MIDNKEKEIDSCPSVPAENAGTPEQLLESGWSQEEEDDHVSECLDWKRQLTLRSVFAGTIIGFALSIISLKLSLTTGIIPSLNIAAGLLGFVFIKTQVATMTKWFSSVMEFNKQENTITQTLAVALYSNAFILGFGSYMIAMDEASWESTGSIPEQEHEIVNPTFSTTIPFAFCVSFTGLFLLIKLRQLFIVKLQLTYPSGTATAQMISGFFSADGAALAKKQFRSFSKFFTLQFLWDLFAWFFSGNGDCGFEAFPTLGLAARDLTWQFNFTWNYVAVGMLCPHIVNYSMVFGAVLSWGILWPIIIGKEGEWYAEGTPQSSLQGLLGYKVFIAIAIILGDSVYQLLKMILSLIKTIRNRNKDPHENAAVDIDESEEAVRETRIRKRVFEAKDVPMWVPYAGFAFFTILGTVALPYIFPVSWQVVLVAYLLIPLFAAPNAYLTGQSDWDLSSTFGKLALFIFAMWSNSIDPDTGIIAGLATCGIVLAGTSQASTLMQDFKTAYLTCTSPRAMLMAQLIGTTLGCFLTPVAFFIFYSAFDIGDPNGPYPAPYGQIYRSMAILGTEGFAALPNYCLELCGGFFLMSMVLSFMRDIIPHFCGEKSKVSLWTRRIIPMPMILSIPFYIGAWLAISVGIGSIIKLIWEKKDKKSYDDFYVPVAAGIIAGDGLWSLPSAFLALGGVNPPICMSFAAT